MQHGGEDSFKKPPPAAVPPTAICHFGHKFLLLWIYADEISRVAAVIMKFEIQLD